MDSFVRIVKCDTPKEGGVDDDEGEDSEQDRLGPEEKEHQRELEWQREKEQARVHSCAQCAHTHACMRRVVGKKHCACMLVQCSRLRLCSGQGKGMDLWCLGCVSLQRFAVCDQQLILEYVFQLNQHQLNVAPNSAFICCAPSL